jgi:hypothetical protein
MNNQFLTDFMKMRRSLGSASAVPVMSTIETPAVKKGKKAKGAPPISKPSGEGITLHYIITEKPEASDVMEYFKNRIDALEEEENA